MSFNQIKWCWPKLKFLFLSCEAMFSNTITSISSQYFSNYKHVFQKVQRVLKMLIFNYCYFRKNQLILKPKIPILLYFWVWVSIQDLLKLQKILLTALFLFLVMFSLVCSLSKSENMSHFWIFSFIHSKPSSWGKQIRLSVVSAEEIEMLKRNEKYFLSHLES